MELTQVTDHRQRGGVQHAGRDDDARSTEAEAYVHDGPFLLHPSELLCVMIVGVALLIQRVGGKAEVGVLEVETCWILG